MYSGAATREEGGVLEGVEESIVGDEEDGKVETEDATEVVNHQGSKKKKKKKRQNRSIMFKRKRQKQSDSSLYVEGAVSTKHKLILEQLELKNKIKMLEESNQEQTQQLVLVTDQLSKALEVQKSKAGSLRD